MGAYFLYQIEMLLKFSLISISFNGSYSFWPYLTYTGKSPFMILKKKRKEKENVSKPLTVVLLKYSQLYWIREDKMTKGINTTAME